MATKKKPKNTSATSTRKRLPDKEAAPSATTAAAPKKVRKKRESKKLYAKITLAKLSELLDGDKTAEVVVSRNFVMDIKKAQIEAKAAAELDID